MVDKSTSYKEKMNASALLRMLLERVDQEIHEEIAKIQNPEENLLVIDDELRKIF